MLNYLDTFRRDDGTLRHPSGYLHWYLKNHGMTPEYIKSEYHWDPREYLYAGTKKAHDQGFVMGMNPQEAGICAMITGIPPGIWIQATVEYYASIGVRL